MKTHKSHKFRPVNDTGPFFYTRKGVWREPVVGEIIYLPGGKTQHRVDREGNLWMRAGTDSKGRARWMLRFFADRTLAALGGRQLPGFGLTSYSLVEPQYTRRKRA